jgi:predicted ATPase
VARHLIHTHRQPGQPVLERLSRRLAGSTLLLVLDHCEPLIDACA